MEFDIDKCVMLKSGKKGKNERNRTAKLKKKESEDFDKSKIRSTGCPNKVGTRVTTFNSVNNNTWCLNTYGTSATANNSTINNTGCLNI